MIESGLTLLRNYVYHTIFYINQIFTCDGNYICSMRIGKCKKTTSIWVVMLVRSLMDHKNRQVILTC